MKRKTVKSLITVFLILSILAVLSLVTVFGINAYVKHSVKDRILTSEEAAALADADCILVLGCYVKPSGKPSDMLADRLTRGVELYSLGAAPKLLMSGDHHQKDYNEVQTMKNYATSSGISSADVFMDHAGLSTYDSLWRAKEVFGAETIIIVSQEYHLYRALHIARQLGIEAYGVASDYHLYAGQWMRELREILARNKDFVMAAFKPDASIGGTPISLEDSGDVTND